MKRPLTIDGIAKLAGVNRSTVSRALNPETASLISEEVRKRILAICDEHNYRPRASAARWRPTRNICRLLQSPFKTKATH